MNPTSLSRRAFLGHASALTGLAAGAATVACRSTPPASQTPNTEDWTGLTATEAVARMRRGDITAEAYATALLERVERLKHLNAFCAIDRDLMLTAARAADKARTSGARLGLLHGLPIPVKDSVNTVAYPTTNGSPLLQHYRPKTNAAVLGPLLAQGAYVMGKTNLHELSSGYTSTNPLFGQVHNPYDPEHIPGGSSGGSAAAVAARSAPLAIGEDSAGSIRVPASWCGICGWRPTYDRYPNAGLLPLTGRFDQVGAMARSVDDLVLFDTAVTADTSPVVRAAPAGVRIGIPNQLMTDLTLDVDRVIAAALARLQDAGFVLVRIDMPELAFKWPKVSPIVEHVFTVFSYERQAATTRFLEAEETGVTWKQLVDPNEEFRPPSRDAYDVAVKTVAALQEQVRSRFTEHNIAMLAYPTSHEQAPRIGDADEVMWQGQSVPRFMPLVRSMYLVTACGHPALTLPAGLSADGLPIGIEFDAPAGTDRQLLAMGLALETALGPIPAPSV